MRQLLLTIASGLVLALPLFAAAEVSAAGGSGAGCAIASIAVEPSGGGMKFTGRALALAPCRFEARMQVERSGANTMKTVQSGSYTLDKGESIDVATVGINIAPGDRLTVDLVLSAGGQKIAESILRTGE